MSETPIPLFADLKLSEPLLRALKDVGYETPSPIQAATIPVLLSNRDVLGQAQTGTGKTAAFALPILSRIDIKQTTPQALVLAPTRELAIQVAEAFQSYAMHIPGFHVLPIYGGQSYGPQLSALRRGVHVVVGTPGRVIDHLDKGSLDLTQLKTLVLDEADEMLRMGFIDDVERILQETPESRQTALFSATMPSAIKRIAQTYLNKPAEITVAAKTGTADNIRQRYWLVSGMHKLDALTRILEAENFDGMIIFSRTKLGTEELASKLQARGFSAAAINGDIQQQQRERTIQQLKDGKIDILVATDVAARGLDVERISHVINYDVPHDPESYTHRIGRTGRAGRSGEAILFITPREKNLLKAIERATRQPVAPLELPTIQAVNDVRIARFKEQISETLAAGELEQFQSIIEEYEQEKNIPAIEIAAALAKMARGDVPLLLDKKHREPQASFEERPARAGKFDRPERPERGDRADRFERNDRFERPAFPKKERIERQADAGMQTYRIEVGYEHGVKPGNIVGAIANEAGLDSKHIGRIEIYDDYSVLDLPQDLSASTLEQLQGVRVAGQQLRIRPDGVAPAVAVRPERVAVARQPAKEFSSPKARDEDHAEPPKRKPKPEALEQVVHAALAEKPTAAKKEKPVKGKIPMQTFRIEVGREHAVTPANIVGAIANEAGLEAKHIGRIDIFDHYSVLDLPDGMPNELFEHLKKVWVGGQQLKISLAGDQERAAVDSKPAPKKAPFAAGKTGGDRRVMEKAAPFKSKSGPGKDKAKPHRKNAK
ncbi:DEAD/DEAH box helicase [Undibacterium terreum]|uniref:ATP-dependent RNA helicase DeaD n=1 Tax=Undibacterium terreum TaxID=1224302 RepID=A0A916U840_9BURK|nr:DEAD/DEAH box helicase [Undibacterium terreum]GGC62973.1 ATP-dependent RNA helicase DeaD [Undibacterium terreum]